MKENRRFVPPFFFFSTIFILGSFGLVYKTVFEQKSNWFGQNNIVAGETTTNSRMCSPYIIEKNPALFVSCGGFLE